MERCLKSDRDRPRNSHDTKQYWTTFALYLHPDLAQMYFMFHRITRTSPFLTRWDRRGRCVCVITDLTMRPVGPPTSSSTVRTSGRQRKYRIYHNPSLLFDVISNSRRISPHSWEILIWSMYAISVLGSIGCRDLATSHESSWTIPFLFFAGKARVHKLRSWRKLSIKKTWI